MRNGFTLIMAIMFLVLIATLSMFALSLSTTSSKHTTDIYLREQAELLAQGATEMAIRNILANPIPLSAANCPGANFFTTTFPRNAPNNLFNVTVDVVQIFGNMNGCGTPITLDTAGNNPSIGTVILDVTVTADQNITNTPVRFHRRTIQKL